MINVTQSSKMMETSIWNKTHAQTLLHMKRKREDVRVERKSVLGMRNGEKKGWTTSGLCFSRNDKNAPLT
jgi:hypothetical protein